MNTKTNITEDTMNTKTNITEDTPVVLAAGTLGEITNLLVEPATGSGSLPVTIKSLDGGYTGREDRTTVLVAKLDGYDRQAQINITEEGSNILEKVDPTEADINVSGDGDTVIIKISSNSSSLQLVAEEFTNNPIVEGSVTLTINGSPVNLTYDATTTPTWSVTSMEQGKYKKYEAIFTIVVLEATGNSETKTVTIKGQAGNTDLTYNLSREATTKYIWVGEEQQTTIDVTIPTTNEAQSVNIIANAAWTITQN